MHRTMNIDNSDTIKRHKGDTKRPLLKKRFLELLLEEKVLGNVSVAAKILGLNRDTVYNWRKKDVKFSKAWEAQIELANGVLADEAENALLNGIRAGNPSLIIFTLKNRRPEKWNDRYANRLKESRTVEHEVSPEFRQFLQGLRTTK